MHELPIMKSIYKTVVTKAESVQATSIRRIVLEVGGLRDYVPEIMQRYWDYIAAGSIAEGARIEVREIDAVAHCGRCGNDYKITRGHFAEPRCPVCGYDRGELIAGSELRIVGIEITPETDGTVQRPA